MVKPSRSDPSDDDDEGIQAWQQQIHEAIASGVANPKQFQRTSCCKPSRSEPDEAHLSPTACPSERQMWRHQELLHCPEQNLMETLTTTSAEAAEEYTDSDYYEGVRAVNKEHHHTTGTGLIQVSETGGFHYLSRPVTAVSNAPAKGKSNPAMNDWVPAEEDCGGHGKVSSKPFRSESNGELD